MKDEIIESIAYNTGRLLKPFVAVCTPIAVLQQLVASTDPDDKQLKFRQRVRKYGTTFMDYKVHQLPAYLMQKAIKHNEWRAQKRGGMTTTVEYNPDFEIEDKKIRPIVDALSAATVLGVSYYEETTHQPPMPQICTFNDYTIVFSPAGTPWCGGVRRVGHISKKRNSEIIQVCDISWQLSDYLADIADKRYKLIQSQKPR